MRMDVVEAARAYLGVPFAHQGRTVHGLDCAGLALLAYRDCGVIFQDIKGYGTSPWMDGLRKAIESQTRKVDDIEPGDVLLMRFIKEPHHIALATDYGMIHSHAKVGRVTEHAIDDKWRRRIVGIYRA